MSSTTLNARSILALLQVLMGSYSTGQLLVRSTSGTVTLAKHSHTIPIFGGQLHGEAILRVEANPSTSSGSWSCTTSGTLVTVASVLGGTRCNLPAGTECRWDPIVAGLEETSEVAAGGLTGGSWYTDLGTLRQACLYRELGSQQVAQDLFRAQVGETPAAVLAWVGSMPADGSASPGYGAQPGRVGRGKRLFKHEWALFLVTSRLDGSDARSREGDELRDWILEVLSDTVAWRGEHVSSPQGIEILDTSVYATTPTSYVDLVRFATSYVLTRRDAQAFQEWLKTRFRVQTVAQGTPPVKIDVPDITVDMRP